jgi:RimJ/RimL family protein N-acetyltransferase
VASRIRKVTKGEHGALAAIHDIGRRAYYQAGGVAAPIEDPEAQAERLRFWSQAIADDHSRAWVAEEGGDCVGFLVAGPPRHENVKDRAALELIGLYLLPEVWGTGLAHSLHERFVQFLSDTPAAREGVLDVWGGNDRAMCFYTSHGWLPDGRTRPGPGDRPYVGLRLPRRNAEHRADRSR